MLANHMKALAPLSGSMRLILLCFYRWMRKGHACAATGRDWMLLRRFIASPRGNDPARAATRTLSLPWTGLYLLLIVLTGCGASSFQISGSAVPLVAATTQGSTDWTTYHHDNTRAGSLINEPDPNHLTHAWSTNLDGAVYAEPLVVGSRVLVATEADSLYSLDIHTGKVQWHTNVGTPVPLSTLPCGNIDPLGITGTPVYDPATGLLFAVAEVTGPSHILVGVDVTTGQIRVHRQIDPAGMDPKVQQQRAALALFGNTVYVAFGGLNGDCGDYHGWVVGSSTSGQGSLLVYQVPTTREGGIWAASGPAIDGLGHLYVAVGNGAATQGAWDHSDSILALSSTLHLLDGFAPTGWQQDNANDADLGSMGPVLLPQRQLFADGKSGLGYLLNMDHLGGIGGQELEQSICASYGGAALLFWQLFVPCTDGVRSVTVGPGVKMTVNWHAPHQINGSPIVGGHTVYSVDHQGGILYALNITSGAIRTQVAVGTTSRFATPTLSQGFVLVGTLTGVTAIAKS